MRFALVVLLLASGCTAGDHTPPTAAEPSPGRTVAPKKPIFRPPAPKLPPRAEESLAPTQAATPAGAKLVSLILETKDSMVTTRYQARTEVNKKKGLYAWDCSGMTNWLLRNTAPRARRAVGKSRPRAIDYYKIIAKSPTNRARRGWQRLEHISDAQPGDLFAFPRSPLSKSKISGHVGVFVGKPWKMENWPYGGEAWAARILDATGLPHQDDTRARDSEGGFGFGTFLFVNDESGDTVAYGWFGTASRGFLPTTVNYGRVSK